MMRFRRLLFLSILTLLLALTADLSGQTLRSPIWIDTGNPTSSAYDPMVCADSGNVYAAWIDVRTGSDAIYFAYSTDNGLTYSGKVRLDGDTTGANKSLEPSSLRAEGSDVYLFWTDERNGLDDVYFVASHNGGKTFGSEIRIDDSVIPGGADVKDVAMASSGNNVYFALNVEINSADEDVFLSVSSDGGATFSTAVHASHGSPGTYDTDTIGLGCFGNTAFVAFDDNSGGNDDLYGRPFDNTGTPGSIVRIDTDPTGYGDIENEILVFMTSATDIHVAWQEERADPGLLNEELRYNRSTDGGATFGASDVLIGSYTAGTHDVDNTVGAASGSTVLLVWEDDRLGSNEAYRSVSLDNGVTWSNDIQISAGGASEPRVALDGDIACVAWSGVNAPDDAFVAWSRDGGTTFGSAANLSNSTGDVEQVALCLDTTYQSCHVIYLDDMLQGLDSNNVFLGSFRSAGLGIQGNLVSGQPHQFEIDGAVAGESGGTNKFIVVISMGLGTLPIPGDGRDVGLRFDNLFQIGLNFKTLLTGSIAQDGTGSTATFSLALPSGMIFYAVGGVRLAGGGFGSITDPVRIKVY